LGTVTHFRSAFIGSPQDEFDAKTLFRPRSVNFLSKRQPVPYKFLAKAVRGEKRSIDRRWHAGAKIVHLRVARVQASRQTEQPPKLDSCRKVEATTVSSPHRQTKMLMNSILREGRAT